MKSCRAAPQAPVVDFAFVAMDANLGQLSSVASLATTLGLRDLMIFPVMRRDEIPAQFPRELDGQQHRADFEKRVQHTVSSAAQDNPEVRLRVCNESFNPVEHSLGEIPAPYPRELPPGAFIYSCEQNPWETTHVLSNGDVVACEVLDRIPLGNLTGRSMGEIWHGAPYQDFRERYRRGEVQECRACPWKRAYYPGKRSSEIIAARGLSAPMLYGWHEPSGENHVWSSQQPAVILGHFRVRTVHVSGILPPGPEGNPNQLSIRLNGTEIGSVANPWQEMMPFGLDFDASPREPAPWRLEFRTTHVYRPCQAGAGTDQRDLGFALVLVVSKIFHDSVRAEQGRKALQPLRAVVQTVDRWAGRAARRWRRPRPEGATWKPGVSIVIPERDNSVELTGCLESVQEAVRQWSEPAETLVIVNGSPAREYHALRQAYPEIRWRFYRRPLGFARAVRAGLGDAQFDWVYLLNSDAALDPSGLRSLASHRGERVFSVASQIVLKDQTRFRDETNWTTLLLESGLATIHDWIPKSNVPVRTFYAGGGASLFRARLLRSLLHDSAYDPFYWEDVEWGWRARKLGYESWFCPDSVAHHTRRSTIGRHYPAEEIERIVARNRLLFQLRNFTTAGSLDRLFEELASSPEPSIRYFLATGTGWGIAWSRIWNHCAPLTDEEVFAAWNESVK